MVIRPDIIINFCCLKIRVFFLVVTKYTSKENKYQYGFLL